MAVGRSGRRKSSDPGSQETYLRPQSPSPRERGGSSMTIRRSLLLAGVLTLALTLPAAVSAAPTAVDVRVEGNTSTIFDGPVTTDGKTITSQPGGAHVC